jgi:site-specific recombinase XerD
VWTDHCLVFTTKAGSAIEPDNQAQLAQVEGFFATALAAVPCLRHAWVSLLLDAGASPHVVQQIVGHSAIDVTMTIYAHAYLEEQKALQTLGKRLA